MMCEIIPNPGRIRMWASGCPKNQNRCWYRIGSPPLAGSKKVTLRLRSVSSLMIATTGTGRDSNSSRAAIANDRTIVGFVQVLCCVSLC
jgi:hypothetical protein